MSDLASVADSVSALKSIDRDTRSVQLSDGSSLKYRHLVLATGGRPRRLGLPNADACKRAPRAQHLKILKSSAMIFCRAEDWLL